MPQIYKTVLGDTWDIIAKKVYNNEFLADRLMDANRDKLDIMIFPADIEIVCPDIETILTTHKKTGGIYDWRS